VGGNGSCEEEGGDCYGGGSDRTGVEISDTLRSRWPSYLGVRLARRQAGRMGSGVDGLVVRRTADGFGQALVCRGTRGAVESFYYPGSELSILFSVFLTGGLFALNFGLSVKSGIFLSEDRRAVS
jgi:hypothetical protein